MYTLHIYTFAITMTRVKESLTMKEDKSTLLVYLLISLCMSMSLSKLAFLKGLLIYSIVFVYTCERRTPSTSFQ